MVTVKNQTPVTGIITAGIDVAIDFRSGNSGDTIEIRPGTGLAGII
jgi:hypothetical protein